MGDKELIAFLISYDKEVLDGKTQMTEETKRSSYINKSMVI